MADRKRSSPVVDTGCSLKSFISSNLEFSKKEKGKASKVSAFSKVIRFLRKTKTAKKEKEKEKEKEEISIASQTDIRAEPEKEIEETLLDDLDATPSSLVLYPQGLYTIKEEEEEEEEEEAAVNNNNHAKEDEVEINGSEVNCQEVLSIGRRSQCSSPITVDVGLSCFFCSFSRSGHN